MTEVALVSLPQYLATWVLIVTVWTVGAYLAHHITRSIERSHK